MFYVISTLLSDVITIVTMKTYSEKNKSINSLMSVESRSMNDFIQQLFGSYIGLSQIYYYTKK